MDEPTLQTAPQPGPAPQPSSPLRPPTSEPSLIVGGEPVPAQAPANAPTFQPFGQPEGGGPSIPVTLPNFEKRFKSGESTEGLTPRPSAWDAFSANAQRTIQDPAHGLGLLYRMGQENGMPSGNQLSPAEAEKRYPGRPIPYTTPVNENIARLEYNDRLKQQQLDEWIARGNHPAAEFAGGMAGSLTDPMALALGAITGGVAETALPATSGFLAKAAAHYLGNWGGFASIARLEDALAGGPQKSAGQLLQETAVPAAAMSVLGLGLSAVARRFLNERGNMSEDAASIRRNAAALEQDQRPPSLDEERKTAGQRRAGANEPGPGQPIQFPAVVTSPIQEAKLYGAAHSDGSPLIHEHGFGPGRQFTDSYDVANNGVSRSTDVPGQVGETKLPEGSKLLDLNKPALGDYEQGHPAFFGGEGSFLKAIEEKLGIHLGDLDLDGMSIKDVLEHITDAAGTKEVPADAMKQIQDIAKAAGYDGYQFDGGGIRYSDEVAPTNRQVHMFDASGMSIGDQYHADPSTTPQFSQEAPTPMQGVQPAQEGNPALEKTKAFAYSPEIEKLVHEFHKNPGALAEYSPEHLASLEKDIELSKKQLADLSEESSTAEKALSDLKEQEVQDTRLRDIAKRIIECGAGGGV